MFLWINFIFSNHHKYLKENESICRLSSELKGYKPKEKRKKRVRKNMLKEMQFLAKGNAIPSPKRFEPCNLLKIWKFSFSQTSQNKILKCMSTPLKLI